MCGIVGYVGRRDACPILIKGLHRLEYRGYDSAGVALVNPDGRLNVFKCKGKVSDLEHFLDGKDLGGNIGIAHTRWATHGIPNDANAHPHYSESENIALIHNGIIENYRVLKDALEQNGYTFRSSTDSEVLVNLIEYVRATSGCSLPEAVRQALRQVIGAYAIAVVEKGNHDRIVAARQSSPMVVGVGDGEFFLSSDAASIIEYTEDFVYVGDGEIAVIDRNAPLKIVTLDNHDAKIDIKKLQLSISQLEKGGYPHFMLKEIYEQPRTIVDCIRGRINPDTCEVKLSGVIDHRDRFVNARRIIFVACGTSWHASLIGEHLVESICRIPVEVEYASEFRYRNPIIREDDIVVAVSQSGETADTLAAVELARKAGAFVFGICNVVGSSIARATDSGAYIHVGPEIGVASTKAFTGQVTVMAMLALAVGRERGTVTEAYYNEVSAALLHLPETMEEVLKVAPQVADLAKIFTYAHNFIYLGRRVQLPHGTRRRAETQGDFVHPRRRLPRGRDEARPHCADRRRDAHRGHRHAGPHLRKNGLEHRGDQGPRRQDHRRHCPRRRTGAPLGRLRDRGPGDRRVPDAHRGIGPAATAGLLHRRLQGPQCRPAPQPRQVGDGGVITRRTANENPQLPGGRLRIFHLRRTPNARSWRRCSRKSRNPSELRAHRAA